MMDVEVANFFIGGILAEYQFKNGQDDGAVRSIVTVFHRLRPRPPRGGDLVYHLPIENLRTDLPAELSRYTVLHTEVEIIRGKLVRPEDVYLAFNSQCSLLDCTKFDGEMLRFYMKEMPRPYLTSSVIEAFGKQPKSDIWVLSNCAFTAADRPKRLPDRRVRPPLRAERLLEHKYSPMEEESFPKQTIIPFPWLRWIIFCYGYNNLFPAMFENNDKVAKISLAHIVQHGAHYKNWLAGESGIGRNFPAAYLQSPDPGTGKTEILKTMNAIMCGPLKKLTAGDATKIGLWEQIIQMMGMTVCVDDFVDSVETASAATRRRRIVQQDPVGHSRRHRPSVLSAHAQELVGTRLLVESDHQGGLRARDAAHPAVLLR